MDQLSKISPESMNTTNEKSTYQIHCKITTEEIQLQCSQDLDWSIKNLGFYPRRGSQMISLNWNKWAESPLQKSLKNHI